MRELNPRVHCALSNVLEVTLRNLFLSNVDYSYVDFSYHHKGTWINLSQARVCGDIQTPR